MLQLCTCLPILFRDKFLSHTSCKIYDVFQVFFYYRKKNTTSDTIYWANWWRTICDVRPFGVFSWTMTEHIRLLLSTFVLIAHWLYLVRYFDTNSYDSWLRNFISLHFVDKLACVFSWSVSLEYLNTSGTFALYCLTYRSAISYNIPSRYSSSTS